MRSHTKEKPFFCDLCGRAFARMDLLKRHKETVHGHGKHRGKKEAGESRREKVEKLVERSSEALGVERKEGRSTSCVSAVSAKSNHSELSTRSAQSGGTSPLGEAWEHWGDLAGAEMAASRNSTAVADYKYALGLGVDTSAAASLLGINSMPYAYANGVPSPLFNVPQYSLPHGGGGVAMPPSPVSPTHILGSNVDTTARSPMLLSPHTTQQFQFSGMAPWESAAYVQQQMAQLSPMLSGTESGMFIDPNDLSTSGGLGVELEEQLRYMDESRYWGMMAEGHGLGLASKEGSRRRDEFSGAAYDYGLYRVADR
jgi:hypothetical protein